MSRPLRGNETVSSRFRRAAVSNVWQRLLGETTPSAEIESTASPPDVMTLAFPFHGTTFELSFDWPQALGEVLVIFGKVERVRTRAENGGARSCWWNRPECTSGIQHDRPRATASIYRRMSRKSASSWQGSSRAGLKRQAG